MESGGNMKIGSLLRQLRISKGLLLREVSERIDLDMTLLSKIEHGDRLPTKDQIKSFMKIYRAHREQLMLSWLSDKIIQEVGSEQLALEAMIVAESKIKYQREKKK